jgi:diguanylate cyclase (GGDEF)-like protein
MMIFLYKHVMERLSVFAQRFDGVIMTAGLGALVLGIAVDVYIIRLVCLIVVIGTASLVFFSLYEKNKELEQGSTGIRYNFRSQSERAEMKKLLFDDFQKNADGKYVVKEVHPSEPVFEPIAEEPPQKVVQPVKLVSSEFKPVVREFHTSDFFDVDSDIFKGDSEPRTEFDFLLNKVLVLIKELVFAHTVVFFWANREKNQMVVEERVTDSKNFMTTRRYPMGHDLVSKVASNGLPEFLAEVNPLTEKELIPYYETPDHVRSFAAVPVFFSKHPNQSIPNQPVAIIAVDSLEEDVFGAETVTTLGQFTKLISALIKSYTEKYDLIVESELLASMKRLQERLKNDFSIMTLQQALADETSKLIQWDFLSIVLYDEKKRSWVAKKVHNRAHEPYIAPEHMIDFSQSVVGQVIKNNLPFVTGTMANSSLPRYSKDEKIESKGSLVFVPLSTANKCYGAFGVESRGERTYSKQDVETLQRLAEIAAALLEVFYLNDVIKEYVIIDDVTGTYSKKFCLQRIEQELQRADDSGSELSLLMLSVDQYPSLLQRFNKDGADRVMQTIAKAIRSCIRSYDIVGRIDESRFAVALINTPANEACLWAEKIRKNIAAHIINIEEKSFSVTISAGVCGALDGMKRHELINNASAVLQKAIETGGNVVRVF